MARKGYAPVPASPADVRAFVDSYRTKYQDDLRALRTLIEQLRATEPGLRSVYKLYSRGENQGFDELKSARKIRLKFNEFNIGKSVTEASLFEVPDIVGLTVVVPYPSGISAVADALDRAVDRGDLVAVVMGKGDEGTGIVSRFGRPLGSKGYFACHYNVRTRGAGRARPICEIQIKTLLHDAWGAKTHDLTYKPSGRIGEELLDSFDLLGSSLANLDKQSDALRTTILRAAEVRERKRRVVQITILSAIAGQAVTRISEDALRQELETIRMQVAGMTPETPLAATNQVSNRLLTVFDDGADPAENGVAASTLLCLLAATTRHRLYFEQAQDALDVREGACSDSIDRLKVKLDGMLTPFASGDVADAIDAGEEMEKDIAALAAAPAKIGDVSQFDRICLNVYSNLAYFHADIIGSHEGEKRRSLACAKTYLEKAKGLYDRVDFPPLGLKSPDDEIISAVGGADVDLACEVFFALDNEAYVGIQCADSEGELRSVRARLDFLHAHTPAGAAHLAQLAVDYHDYCARARLSELESALR